MSHGLETEIEVLLNGGATPPGHAVASCFVLQEKGDSVAEAEGVFGFGEKPRLPGRT
jgi:hypothetical protein